MEILRDLYQLPETLRGGAVAIGKFDGVHCGHARIIEQLTQRAKMFNGPAIVFTFDPSPVQLLAPEHAPLPLCWNERKAELLSRLGVDAMIVYPTDRAFLDRSAEDFFEHIVVDSLGAKAIVEGYNFYFGKNREGDVEYLKQLADQFGVVADVIGPMLDAGRAISSSRVRALLHEGDIDRANGMLTSPYRIRGRVIVGEQRGRTLGFPTANLETHDTLLPKAGIYAGVGHADGRAWPAAIALGPNLTFDAEQSKLEAYLSGYDGDLYGQTIEIDFLHRLRDLTRFDTVEALKKQMHADVRQVTDIVDRQDHA